MATIFGSGMIDLIIALVALEALALAFWRYRTGRGPAFMPLVCNLLAGTFLLLALRNSLEGSSPVWIVLCLLAAFLAHVLDVRERWNSSAQSNVQSAGKANMNATISLRVPKQKPYRADHNPTGE